MSTNTVSIPNGSIKSHSEFDSVYDLKRVSIPNGSIKRKGSTPEDFAKNLFQFLMVQLKDVRLILIFPHKLSFNS